MFLFSQHPGFQEISNGSDNFLLSIAMDGPLGCSSWMASDLADVGTVKAALPLDELSAFYYQKQPIAVVPVGDPMTTTNGLANVIKTNAFRVNVGQPPVLTAAQADTVTYCEALGTIGPARFNSWSSYLVSSPSLDPDTSANLLGFLTNRFIATWGSDIGLNCVALLGLPCPIAAVVNTDGLTIGFSFVSQANLIPSSAFQPGGQFYSGVVTPTPTPTNTTAPTPTAASIASLFNPVAIAFIAAFGGLVVFNIIVFVCYILRSKPKKVPAHSMESIHVPQVTSPLPSRRQWTASLFYHKGTN